MQRANQQQEVVHSSPPPPHRGPCIVVLSVLPVSEDVLVTCVRSLLPSDRLRFAAPSAAYRSVVCVGEACHRQGCSKIIAGVLGLAPTFGCVRSIVAAQVALSRNLIVC
ncbi:hypothetical protein Micbo1qcDRAFT_170092 [Microdochium bolleyi]|uniref:Uncharacterized protein n=1 Tax=Microdochium bolleyi TaxID=196109 RepID=A0A136II54_9PEZI|nr:hypothetical protein Micbo1qcDRAFT_170092 [Microdochium bolleyi]